MRCPRLDTANVERSLQGWTAQDDAHEHPKYLRQAETRTRELPLRGVTCVFAFLVLGGV